VVKLPYGGEGEGGGAKIRERKGEKFNFQATFAISSSDGSFECGLKFREGLEPSNRTWLS
jgi:hypothetical protein